jgi:hypothetical protein
VLSFAWTVYAAGTGDKFECALEHERRTFEQHCVQKKFDHVPHIEPPFYKTQVAKGPSLDIYSLQARSKLAYFCQKILLVLVLPRIKFAFLINDPARCQF